MSPVPSKDDFVQSSPVLKYELLDNFKGLGQFIFDVHQNNPNEIAQIEASTGKSETYGELNKRCVQLALELKRFGIQPGDIITICSLNTLDVCVPIIAGLYVGATLSFLDPTISIQTTTHLFSQVKPKMIFCTSDCVELLEQSLEANNHIATMVILDNGKSTRHLPFSQFFKQTRDKSDFQLYIPEDIKETSLILFSSGTTGLAKGICLSHYGLMYSTLHWKDMLLEVKVVMNFTSFYWISAVMNFLISCMVTGTRIIVPCFDASTVLETIQKYKVNFTITTTINNQHLKNQDYTKYDMRYLKFAGVGGTPSTDQQMLDVRRVFPYTTIIHGYGMTELSGLATGFYDSVKYAKFILEKPGSVGVPVPGNRIKVVDVQTETSLGPNKMGELRHKSPTVMNGYHNRDSSEAWDSHGWLCSGDIGYYDEDGCFYIKDRIKDMLKFRSWHVTPSAIESVLMQHPKVKEAVVIGIPHEVDGDLALGIVVLNDEIDRDGMEAELIKFVADRVGFRDRLHGGLKIVQSIPRTPTGKSRKRDIKIMILEGKL